MASEFPGWSGAGGTFDAAWRTVVLGDVVLPGVCTVNGLGCGVDIDTKKAKGQDCPTSKDNGVDASKFSIEVWLTERDWPRWVEVVGRIHPRRPGRERAAVEIQHPEPNVLGITHVRILAIHGFAPTAKGGKKYRIDVVEYFDAPKPVKDTKKVKHITAQKYYEDPNALARDMAQNQGYILPPADPENISTQLYR
jgi:hypothetical protein